MSDDFWALADDVVFYDARCKRRLKAERWAAKTNPKVGSAGSRKKRKTEAAPRMPRNVDEFPKQGGSPLLETGSKHLAVVEVDEQARRQRSGHASVQSVPAQVSLATG